MAVITPEVNVYFGLGFAPNSFVIGHPTKGVIGNATYLIGDSSGAPTNLATSSFGISIHRGRSSVLDDFTAGTATVNLHQLSRDFDPFNTAGPYYGKLTPGRKINISVYGVTIYSGTIDDWDVSWSVDRLGDNATIKAVDRLGDLARIRFDAWSSTDGQLTGARINEILNRPEIGETGAVRDIDAGASTLTTDNITWDSQALNYLQLVARSDFGRFFASRTNVATFRDRHSLLGATTEVTFRDDSNDGTAAKTPFHGAQMSVGSDFLYNRVGVDRVGGTLQTASDATSQTTYGVRSLNFSGLLQNSDAQTLSMANWLVGLYKDPLPLISEVTVKVHALSAAQMQAVCQLDIGSLVQVVWTPRSTGSAIDDLFAIDGIDHVLTPDEHIVTLTLTPAETSGVFIIGDPVWGVIGGPGRISF